MYKQKSGTSKPVEHLRKAHRILEDTAFEQRTWHAQKTIQHAMTRASEIEEKRHLHRQSNASSQALDPAVLEQLYVRWIMTHSVSFSQSSWTEFRSFLKYVNLEANRLLSHSFIIIARWIQQIFKQEQSHVRQSLYSSLSSVHFTVDL